MRAMRHLEGALLCAATVVAAGCGDSGTGPTTPPTPVPNFVRLESDAGDWIGQGKTYEYTQANAIVSVSATGGHLSVLIRGDQTWHGEFQTPSGSTRILPGTYGNLNRFPFNNPQAGGLSWSGDGRGCNTLTGSFSVDTVRYAGDTLTAIDLRFEQHCEGGAPALEGTVHWRRGDPTRPPGPRSIPSTLWRPPAGSVPAVGNYVYLQSDAGDYIGQGFTQTYTQPGASIAATASAGHLSVTVDGSRWFGDFQTMNTIGRVEQGYYPDLLRFPFHNPVKGGLSWSGEGRGCNRLRGWFVVDRVTYSGNTLTGIELRFEQHCEEGTPALRGAIRWDA